ncbi:MAG: DUF2147 domain-containing protein [Bacteroidia bacterium]
MRLAKRTTLSTLILFFAVLGLNAQSPVGKWKTIDDETGDQKSIVEIFEKDGKLYGKVVQLFRKPSEEQDPICDECSKDDPRYNKRVMGMVILEGLVKGKGNVWEDGEILDPKNGSVYSCYIELMDKNKLKVRGYLGFSLIGRTQYWYKVE